MPVQHPVLKVLTSDQWDHLQRAGEPVGSPDDERDGFVHLSTVAQVGETIAKHFAGADLLVVVTLDAVDLGGDLRWEPSRGGQDFPHLYRPLRLGDVRAVRHLRSAPIPGAAVDAEPEERWRVLDAVPRDADERTMLEPLLDWYRDGVQAKVAGLSDEQARQRHVGSQTTIVGVVMHLALVEDHWFEHCFAGRPLPGPWQGIDWEADPDGEFVMARDGTLAGALELHRQAVGRSRAVQAQATLEDIGAIRSPDRGPFTMRWLLLHMLEEVARHLGHLDVLRELTDGATGE